jgi:hypothetical protein
MIMRQLIVLTIWMMGALGFCSGSVVAAPQLPKEFVGAWCTEILDRWVYLYRTEDGCDDGRMTFKQDEYVAEAYSCRYLAIKSWRDYDLPLTTRRMGAIVASIESQCVNEGDQWKELLVIYFSQGLLFVREKITKP